MGIRDPLAVAAAQAGYLPVMLTPTPQSPVATAAAISERTSGWLSPAPRSWAHTRSLKMSSNSSLVYAFDLIPLSDEYSAVIRYLSTIIHIINVTHQDCRKLVCRQPDPPSLRPGRVCPVA